MFIGRKNTHKDAEQFYDALISLKAKQDYDAKLAPCSCGHKVEIKECERQSLDKGITVFCVYCPECLSYTEFVEGVTMDKVVYFWNNQHKGVKNG